MMWKRVTKPQKGDLAVHSGGVLDSRFVVEVSPSGDKIKLDIRGYTTDWLPTKNYTFKRKAGAGA